MRTETGVPTATGILCSSTRVKVLFDVIYRPAVVIVRAPATKLNTSSQPRGSDSSGQSTSCTAAFADSLIGLGPVDYCYIRQASESPTQPHNSLHTMAPSVASHYSQGSLG